MPRYFLMTVAAFAAGLMFLHPLRADSEKPARSSDKPFIVRTLVGGQTEIQAGKLADDRGTDPVKAYAKKVVADRTRTDSALQKLADERGIHTPQEPLYRKSLIERLSKLHGKAFDHAFLAAMVNDQQSAIALFKRQLDYGADEEVKNFAKENLPALEAHLKSSRQLLKSAASTTQATQPSKHDEPTMMK